jgi:hypothetical protein
MRSSFDIYGKHYDKEFVQEHAVLFMRQALWAEEHVEELMSKPLMLEYFDFDTMTFKYFPVRDMRAVSLALDAARWNRQKYKEAFYD